MRPPSGPCSCPAIASGGPLLDRDGEEVATVADLLAALVGTSPVEQVVLTVLRGGDRRDVALTLSRRPEQLCERMPARAASTSLLGTTPLH